jgi:hypothetical protein
MTIRNTMFNFFKRKVPNSIKNNNASCGLLSKPVQCQMSKTKTTKKNKKIVKEIYKGVKKEKTKGK